LWDNWIGFKKETAELAKEETLFVEERIKVKHSLNRPGVAQRIPGGLGSQISMTFGTLR
jgi:hypothetical protein